MKKYVALLLALIVVLGLFVGCGDNETASSDNVGSNDNITNVDDGIFSKDTVKLLESDNSSRYRVVRPDEDALNAGAQYIFKQLKNLIGANVKNVSDKEDGTDLYEIIVGECDRDETRLAKAYLEQKIAGRYNDYIVCTIGKKIVIYGQNPDANTEAAKYFIENFAKKGTVEGGILYTYAAQGDFESITVNGVEVGKFELVRPHYNCSYLTELEMQSFVEDVYNRTGYMMEILHDQYTAERPARYEIIIGDTSREGVEAVTDSDTYKITIKGTKIYINGGSPHAVALGVSEFKKMLKGNVTDASSVTGSYNETIKSYDGATTLKKTWGDDFEGDKLDLSIWTQPDNMSEEGYNGKTAIRSTDPNDVYVRDGKFHICARQDENYYYGGYITTRDHLNYKYGYAEISALLPHGEGFWTAFWAGTTDYTSSFDEKQPKLLSPEIDIMECFGNSTYYAANMHRWPTKAGSAAGYKHTSLDISQALINDKKFTSVDEGVVLGDDFHTYGFMWTPQRMDFICDGEVFFSRDTNNDDGDVEAFNHSLYIIISMSVGGANDAGGVITDNEDEWMNSNKYIVDYINIYQYDDGASQFTYSERPIIIPGDN